MCVWFYLNRDGIGKDTHLSLFFVAWRREFDNILQWLFNYCYTQGHLQVHQPDELGGQDVVGDTIFITYMADTSTVLLIASEFQL